MCAVFDLNYVILSIFSFLYIFALKEAEKNVKKNYMCVYLAAMQITFEDFVKLLFPFISYQQ